MITKFKRYNEMLTSKDTRNILDLNIETGDNTSQNPGDLKRTANLKITDINNKINELNKQKELINKEIINLQSTQRDLAPNNQNDPKNAEKLNIFIKDQQEKINIQKQKLSNIEDEIKNLQSEIFRHKQNYL